MISIESLERNRFIREINNKLHKLNSSVFLWWTKAHVGNRGNERLDYFAKKATGKNKIDFHFCKTKLQRKTEMKKVITQNWQTLWDKSSKGKRVKKLYGNVDEKRVIGDFYLLPDHYRIRSI